MVREPKIPQAGNFPGGLVTRNPPANAGDKGSIPGPGRSHRRWNNEACALEPRFREKPGEKLKHRNNVQPGPRTFPARSKSPRTARPPRAVKNDKPTLHCVMLSR